MTYRAMIWKELRERPTAMTTCLLAILLGVTALVAIRNVTVFSEQAVARKLDALGANVLLLPQSVSLQDYYAADMHERTLPEEHATRLALANLEGVENISPKLCIPATLGERAVTLTGILPQSEFQSKAAWQSVKLFSRKHAGCKKACAPLSDADSAPESLATRRVVQKLGSSDALVGADVAEFAGVKAGDKITLLDKRLTVVAVLPATGTVDDGRVFAHLHTVQDMAQAGPVVNVIEVMGCCEDAAGNLIPRLREMFADAKVVTIAHVVETQVGVNRLMSRLSFLFVGVLVLVGGASIAGTMFSNVAERRREIGTLMALGATPRFVLRLFLGKAVIVGLVGGVLGFLAGTSVAVALGPHWAGVSVTPLPSLALISAALAVAVALTASYWPARRAARLDPCMCFQEI